MSRSCHVKVERQLTAEERAYLSFLGTEICHIQAAKKRIGVPQLNIFNPALDFGGMIGNIPQLGEAPLKRVAELAFATSQQRAAFEAIAVADRALGGGSLKALPPVAGAIPVEFFIRPRRQEMVAVRPRINDRRMP